ncbi:MAG: type II toxin-antitoxin system VapC family toxin [Candidatus Kapaibacterium sp.]|jgi:predicted nucleic acid-binding protein|nr:type II toxin-antitoxin system VapC family toxin [Ignavibacteria bacterium]HRE57727.1 type II toxin-antitoxin system VapC family toxin [Candidatus Kapabacteria bacterium]HRK60207.1 type II toxin-antitoxin system VapC family toxin [Candidatus Kapabacteria bacterium]
MEQPQYLMDTNVVIDYLGNKLPASSMDFMNDVIDAVPHISVITKIEVLGFNAPEQHYTILSDFINDAIVFDLSNNVVEASIVIRKKYKTKLPDAIIAATALVYDLIVISRNISDFKNIDGLKVIDPHSL